MKKFLYLLMAIALICSCEKNEEWDSPIPEKPIGGNEEMSTSTLPEQLYAYMADDEAGTEADDEAGDEQTRTFVENNKVLWHNGDDILYCTYNIIGAQYKFEGNYGVKKATFKKVGDGKSGEVAATFPVGVFPYRDYFGAKFNINDIEDETDNTWTITPDFEQYQNYVPNSFDKDANIMIAAGNGEDNNLTFRNACGYVVIRLYGTNVVINRVRLFATPTGYTIPDQPRIWGKLYDIDVDTDGNLTYRKLNPAGIWFQNMIELNCVDSETQQGVRLSEDKNNPTEFWFAVPPMFLENGISITAIDSNGNYINKESSGSFEIERNTVKRMAAVDATNSSRTTCLWYKTSEDEPLSKFATEHESFKYFDAKIVSHRETVNDENKKWMTCIEFDRPLTEIKKDAFKDANLTEIILPDALKTIGESAFEGNEPLKSVTFQSAVTTVGKRAFYENTNLEVCNVSENLTTIGDEAFRYTGITSPIIPGKVTHIGQNAFADCKKLTSVTIESGSMGELMTIGKGAFQYSGLTTINIPRKVVRIEQEAFADCESLATVTFESGSTPLTIGAQSTSVSGDHPFYDSNNITTLSLNRELVKAHSNVSMNLFKNHTKLASVDLGEEVKTIYNEMFYNTGITSITIPGSVTRIDYSAFSNCAKLAAVTFEPSSTSTPITINSDSEYRDYTPFYGSTAIKTLSLNRELVSGGNGMTMALFMDHTNLNSVTLGNQVKTIHSYMFHNSGLTSIDIPGSVITIGSDAFGWCNKLEKVTIAEGSTRERSIGDAAFYQCANLKSVTLNGITTIGELVFRNCKRLSSLVIPGSVNVIGNHTFDGCIGLTSVTFADGEGSLIIGFNPNTNERGPFYNSPLTEINLNRDIVMASDYEEAIDDYDEGVFSYEGYKNDGHRTTLTVGNGVTHILPYMFAGSCITSVNIPASVTEVGYNAFQYCIKLSEVNIEESSNQLTLGYQYYNTAEWGPFYDSPLTSITLKRDIKYVKDTKDKSFSPDHYKEGVFSNKHRKPTKLSLGGGLTKIIPYMFSYTGVGAAVINNQITTTPGSVWIPHTVRGIGNYAFCDCDYLAGLTMGFDGSLFDGVPKIGDEVFDDCDKFKYIKVRHSQRDKFNKVASNDPWRDYFKYLTSDPSFL